MPFDLPDRISLLQAALWMVKGRKPVTEERFRIARVSLSSGDATPEGPLGDLVVALHEKKLQAYSSLGSRRHSEITAFRARTPDAPVKPTDWRFEEVSWNESALSFRGNLPPEFKAFTSQFADVNRGPAFWFPISLGVQDLVAVFPQLLGQPAEQSASEQPASKAGRKRKWNWDGLFQELVVKADLDGLPEKQGDCEAWAHDWFFKQVGESPAESTVREMISPIYNHKRKAGN